MDWFTFLSNIINSIAWPMTLILIIFMLRTQLIELLPGLKHLKFKDLELQFEKRIVEIDQKVEQAKLPEPDNTSLIPGGNADYNEKYNYLKEINNKSPREAIIESWFLVEQEINRISNTYLDKSTNRTPLMIIRQLSSKKIVPEELLDIIDQLRLLRNEAVHTKELKTSVNVTKEYINNVFRVLAALKEIT